MSSARALNPALAERRLAALRGDISSARLTGLLVSHLPNIRYLTGFTGSAGCLLVEADRATLFTDFRYESQAAYELAGPVSATIVQGSTWSAIAEWLSVSPPGRRIGFEGTRLSVADHASLAEACGSVIWESTSDLVEGQRAVKAAEEIRSIEAAVDLADCVLDTIVAEIRPGTTELRVAARLEYNLRASGSGPLPFAPIVAFGERSAMPHATPSSRELAQGDLVLLDFGATVDGYCSDMTRVFTLGRAAEWQQDLHREVLAACEAGVSAAGPSVACADVDRAARGRLEEAGLADRFGHSTGHGVGLEVHEAPRLHKDARDALAVGNVVTVEPGVYLPGRGGIRIEQVVVVDSGGSRLLTRSSPELIEL